MTQPDTVENQVQILDNINWAQVAALAQEFNNLPEQGPYVMHFEVDEDGMILDP